MLDVCLVEAESPLVTLYHHIPETLLTTAALLEEEGKSAQVWPANAQDLPASEFLVISANIIQYHNAIDIAKRAKKARNVKVILCGNFVTAAPEEAMSCSLFDFGIAGDPEYPVMDLICGKKYSEIHGLLYRGQYALSMNPMLDLKVSEIPGPDYKLWRGQYHRFSDFSTIREFKMADYWVPRGFAGKKHNYLIRVQIWALKRLGVRQLYISDYDFVGGIARVSNALMAFSDIPDGWMCNARSETALANLDPERMAEAGCKRLYLDVCSGSMEICSRYDREFWSTHARALRLFGNHMEVVPVFTIGWPGETVETLAETERTLKYLGCKAFVRTFVTYPGDYIYEHPLRYDRLGFMVTAVDHADFWVDDSIAIRKVPWGSVKLDMETFFNVRNELVCNYNDFEDWKIIG